MAKKKKVENLNLLERPPIVVVLGHVDHGKTTLLDYIRKTNVAEKESGGITQHIGAYQIVHKDKTVTFIDTPGHEAFSQMRSRGAKVADVAILVVAAEEGVKPQTKEVISHIKEFEIPVVVAINKIDKPVANPSKVIGELAKEGIVAESQGGKVPSVNVSAKTGQGVDELLEVILLVAEMEELKVDSTKPASGVVIESYLDSKRGPVATLLIQEGILKKSDIVSCGEAFGRIKNLEDFQGKAIDHVLPSTPVLVLGLNQVPVVGEKFEVVDSEETAMSFVAKSREDKKVKASLSAEAPSLSRGAGGKILNLILKTDVRGSLEAIEGVLKNIKQENVIINILKSEVGDISESDVKLAFSTGSTIIGFRVKLPNFILDLAKRQGVRIKTFEIIYELVEEVKRGLVRLLEPEVIREDLGKLKALAIFRKEKSRMIIGGKVISGKVENKALVNIIRNEEKIGKGRIIQLQQNKKDINEVEKGKEAGILFEGDMVIEEGDVLEVYKEEKKKREL
jgi:translation initiation factor IF-2